MTDAFGEDDVLANPTIKKLRAFSRRDDPTNREIMRNMAALIVARNDRWCGILGGTIVERTLEGVLKRRMVNLNSSEETEMFGPRGIVSTFGAKAAVAYAMGVITKKTRRNIDCLREIRNAFAHSFVPIYFSTKEVKDAVNLLWLSPDAGKWITGKSTLKKHYVQAVISTVDAIRQGDAPQP